MSRSRRGRRDGPGGAGWAWQLQIFEWSRAVRGNAAAKIDPGSRKERATAAGAACWGGEDNRGTTELSPGDAGLAAEWPACTAREGGASTSVGQPHTKRSPFHARVCAEVPGSRSPAVSCLPAAEKVSSLGKDWHKFCLKCERCNKTLTPGGHAEVRGARGLGPKPASCPRPAAHEPFPWLVVSAQGAQGSLCLLVALPVVLVPAGPGGRNGGRGAAAPKGSRLHSPCSY